MPRPLGRVLTLLELLQSGGLRTVPELADRLDVDERTVRRYVQQLLDLDVPVESVRGRYGGYRIGPGYRMPPLMLNDDEALAVLLGLVAGRRSGLTAATGTAGETATAKIRRVLPERLRSRLDAVLGSLAFTDPPGGAATPGTSAPGPGVLLPVADAVRQHRPLSVRYTAGDGGRSERVLHPYGIVAHSGRWYVTAVDVSAGEERTFRLDRITGVRVLPGSFQPPAGVDPAQRVLTGLATVPYRYEVVLRVRGTAEHLRERLPAGLAIVTELPSPGGPTSPGEPTSPGGPTSPGEPTLPSGPTLPGEPSPSGGGRPETGPCCRVELRAERLDWLPAVLASLDRPFVIDRPDELRDLVRAFAERLAASARKAVPP